MSLNSCLTCLNKLITCFYSPVHWWSTFREAPQYDELLERVWKFFSFVPCRHFIAGTLNKIIHWNSLHRNAVESPSHGIFKNQLDRGLDNLIETSLFMKGWNRRYFKMFIPCNLSCSMILWSCLSLSPRTAGYSSPPPPYSYKALLMRLDMPLAKIERWILPHK